MGILWLVAAGLYLILAVAEWMTVRTLVGKLPGTRPMPKFVPGIALRVSGFLIISAIASLAAGAGLLKQQPWARILALVLAFLGLFTEPLGAALGIYTLWVLLGGPSAEAKATGPLARKALRALKLGCALALLTFILGLLIRSDALFPYLAPGFYILSLRGYVWHGPLGLVALIVGTAITGVLYSVPVFVVQMILDFRRR